MNILEKIVEGCKITIKDKQYNVYGKTLYVTKNEPNNVYSKILLEDSNVLVIIPKEEIAYFGKNLGRIENFNSFNDVVEYNEKKYSLVNHDYQIVLKVEFGNILELEGEVEFWDYEIDNSVISVGIVSRDRKRADVLAEYIPLSDIKVEKNV